VISISVSGAERIAAKFLAAATIVPAVAVPSALDKAALLVVRSAKQKAPFDTGALRGQIDPSRPSANEADVTSHADYSIYQEVGTYKMAAHPYMRPALDENKDQIEELLGHSVMAAVQGVMA
jgi:HK97 gp10 family phage protein